MHTIRRLNRRRILLPAVAAGTSAVLSALGLLGWSAPARSIAPPPTASTIVTPVHVRYRAVDVTLPGATVYSVDCVNNRGDILGAATFPDRGMARFLLKDGRVTILSGDASLYPGHCDEPFRPSAMSEAGAIVGAWIDGYNSHTVFYDGRNPVAIDNTDFPGSYPFAINHNNEIVGIVQLHKWDEGPNNNVHAARYVTGRHWQSLFLDGPHWQDLGTLGGSRSYAFGINDSGAVVGMSDVQPGNFPTTHAFLDQDGKMTDLTPGHDVYASRATAINRKGDVAGQIYREGERGTMAALYRSGKWESLGTLPGYVSSYATGINANDTVIGTCSTRISRWDDYRPSRHCTFVSVNHHMYDPSDLLDRTADDRDLKIYDLHNLNDHGVIAATAVRDGKYVPVVLVPENGKR